MAFLGLLINQKKEEKEKKRQYGLERYKNLPEDEKQKLFEYRKKYKMKKKTPYNNYKKLFSFRKFVFSWGWAS